MIVEINVIFTLLTKLILWFFFDELDLSIVSWLRKTNLRMWKKRFQEVHYRPSEVAFCYEILTSTLSHFQVKTVVGNSRVLNHSNENNVSNSVHFQFPVQITKQASFETWAFSSEYHWFCLSITQIPISIFFNKIFLFCSFNSEKIEWIFQSLTFFFRFKFHTSVLTDSSKSLYYWCKKIKKSVLIEIYPNSHWIVCQTLPTQKRTVTLIPGDGIGPEISAAVQRIFEVSNKNIKVIVTSNNTHYHPTHNHKLRLFVSGSGGSCSAHHMGNTTCHSWNWCIWWSYRINEKEQNRTQRFV